MTNFRRLRTEQGSIYAPAAINAAMEANARDVAHAVMGDAFEIYVDEQPWHVVNGLEVYTEGDNDIAMTPGIALSRSGGVPRIVSLWSGMEAYAGSLPVPDLTDPRIDIVCLVVTDASLASSTQGRVGDVPAPVYTQSGASAVLTIVAGTPDAAPVAPALPADAILLAHCLTETDGTVTILDKRRFATTPRRRTAGEPNLYVMDTDATADVQLVTVYGRSPTLDASGPVGTPFQSMLKWNSDLDMLTFDRDRGITDETSGDHVLMMIPGGRSYQITRAVGYQTPGYWFQRLSGTPPLSLEITDIEAGELRVGSSWSGSDRMVFSIPIETDLRGLELGSAGIIFSAASMSSTTMTVKFQHRRKFDSSWSDVASKTFTINTTFAAQEWALDLMTPTLATGCVRFSIDVNKSGGGAGGTIYVRGVAFSVIEGRDF